MCGIAALLGPAAAIASPACVQLQQDVEAAIARRGPDHLGSIKRSTDGAAAVVLSAAVLHLRGDAMATQPVLDEHGSVLLWNGEVFGGQSIPIGASDTAVVAQVLFDATREDVDPTLVAAHVVEALASLEGPFALIFYHEATKTLVYGRDRLGRRSLLEHMPSSLQDDDVVVIASVAHPNLVSTEIPCTGLFYCNYGMTAPGLARWPPSVPAALPRQMLPAALDTLAFDGAMSPSMRCAAKGFLGVLYRAVATRLESIPLRSPTEPRVGVLFSGGLDSVVLAALAHHALPPDEPLELYNVCFDTAHASPDRKAAVASWNELRHLFPTRDFRLVEMDVDGEGVTAAQPAVLVRMQPCATHMDFNIGTAFWFLARGIGSLAVERPEVDAPAVTSDCMWFAAPTDARCAATKCKRQHQLTCEYRVCKPCCLKLHKLAAKLAPTRHPQESASARAALGAMGVLDVDALHAHVQGLSQCANHTLVTRPDTSPQCAPRPPYVSKVKVLLVGIGADEQLAGYGRHKAAFERDGYDGLRAELCMDMNRLWLRNLGRDDRMISDHGREARFPYLDEHVVRFLAATPLEEIVDFSQPRGVGDKLLLRVVGRGLGLRHCTGLPKQAIQFGTRMAKQSNAISSTPRHVQGATPFLPANRFHA